MRVRFSIPVCIHPPPPFFSSISSDPCSWLWPFLHPVQYFQEPNVSNHQKWLPTQNGINFSLVRPPHFRVREHIHTLWWASSAQCKPIPLWLSANKWLPAGWKKGMVRNVLNHFQLILLPSLFGTTWKGQFFHEVCGGGTQASSWLWLHTDIDLLSSSTTCTTRGSRSRPVGFEDSLEFSERPALTAF